MIHLDLAMILTDEFVVENLRRITKMKKLMTIALGLGLVLGLTTATFAADKATKAKSTKMKSTKTKSTKMKSTAKM
jgi:hypothetical protein